MTNLLVKVQICTVDICYSYAQGKQQAYARIRHE